MADKDPPELLDSIRRLAIKQLLDDINKHQREQGWSEDYAPPPVQMPEEFTPDELPAPYSYTLPAKFNQPQDWDETNPFRKLMKYRL